MHPSSRVQNHTQCTWDIAMKCTLHCDVLWCTAIILQSNALQCDAAQYDPLGCTIAIDTCGRPRNSCPQCVTDRRNIFQHIVVRFNMANGMWPSSVFFDLSNSLCGMKTLERVFFTLRFHLEMFKYLIKIEECLWDDIFRHQWQYPTKYMEYYPVYV